MKPARLTPLMLALGALVVCLAPLVWLISTSLKPFDEVLKGDLAIIPHSYRLKNFTDVLGSLNFTRSLMNSVIVSFLTVLGTLFSAIPAGYAFAKLRNKGATVVFAILLASIMLPGQTTIIPIFRLFAKFHLINTYVPLVLPAWLGTNAFAIFLLRQFFVVLPSELFEAARLDGASELRILWQVACPLAKPGLITVAVIAFLGSWNDLWGPLIYLNSDDKATLQVALLNFVGGSGTAQGIPWNLVMAAVVIAVAPAFLLFALCQKSFIEGISTTGGK